MVNRQILKDFLIKHGCKNTERVMSVLEPLYQIADECKYELTPKDGVNENELKQGIATAIGEEVKKIIFVSRGNPFPKPEWMTEEIYQRSLRGSPWNIFWGSPWDILKDSLWDSLGDSLGDSLKDSLWDILRDSFWNSFRDSLRDILRDSFGNSLGISLRDILRDSFRNSLGISLRDGLFLFTGFSLLNNELIASRLEPLIRLFAKFPIFGEKKDEPGTWLVMVE